MMKSIKKLVWWPTRILLPATVLYAWLLGYWLFLGRMNPNSDLIDYPAQNLIPILMIICAGHAMILTSVRVLKDRCPISICLMADLSILPLLFVWGAATTVFVYGQYLFDTTPKFNSVLEQTIPHTIAAFILLINLAYITSPKNKTTPQVS